MRKLLLCAIFAAAFPASAMAAEVQPGLDAYMGLVSGAVQVQMGGSDVWAIGKLGQRLTSGTQIKTEAGSSCTIVFTDQSKIRLGSKANFKMETLSPSKVAVYLGLGNMETWVKKNAARTFQARNPVSVASIRGTVFAMNVLSPTSVTVDVFEGNIAVQDNFGNTTSVGEGQRVEANATTGASAPAPVPANVLPPTEPTIAITIPAAKPVAAAAPSAPKPAQQAKPTTQPAPQAPAEVPVETAPTQPETTVPPPNPTQETETPVSPSSP